MIFDALLLEVILLLACAMALGAWQRDPSTTGRLTFCALAVGAGALTLGEFLVLRGITSELVADRVKYAGLLLLPPLWLGFAAHVAGLEIARRIPWFPALLLLPGALLYALMFDDRFSVLFLTTVEGGDDLYGPLWWAQTIYGQSLALAGSLILASTALRARVPAQRVRRGALAAASLLPLLGNGFYLVGWLHWPYDPTPVLLGATLLAMRSAVFEGGLVEPLPISQRALIHQLPLGIILTDHGGTIVEMSDVAANRLGVFEQFALGRSLDEVLAWCEPTPLRSTDLVSRGRVSGRLVLLD
ncbi:MAG: histidine kinase N-terminal 7TM domain-containing protein [Myxococcota bacterium]